MAQKVTPVNPNKMEPAVAPIALDYLASALAGHHFQADCIDVCFSLDWTQDLDSYFKNNSAAAVGVSLRNTDDTSSGAARILHPHA